MNNQHLDPQNDQNDHHDNDAMMGEHAQEQNGDNPLLSSYTHFIVGQRQLVEYMEELTDDVGEQHVLCHYLINICICFHTQNGPYLTEYGINRLYAVVFAFQEGRFHGIGGSPEAAEEFF